MTFYVIKNLDTGLFFDSFTGEWVKEKDKIELLGNLTFEQLNLTSGSEAFSQHTIIQLKSTGEYLAIVENITPERLESGNFI